MDPVTAAILAGVAASAGKVAEQVVSDAYAALKELLRKKFGSRSKVVEAVRELEANPNSEGRKTIVREEVAAVKAENDQELLVVAQALLKNLKAVQGGTEIVQSVMGNQNIQIAGDGNAVNVNSPKA